MDGLTAVLEGHPPGRPVKLTEVRARIPRHASSFRVAEVLTDLELLEDDSALAIRSSPSASARGWTTEHHAVT
ncbi:hypothetical protein [Streptomyces avermitilis]|uniref:hypothetical protein n=1 Tax=Streptomyces avermitilis TaxID=33903 RepID=UPI003711DCB8